MQTQVEVNFRSFFSSLIAFMTIQFVMSDVARAGYDVVLDIDWTILSPIPEADRAGRTDLIFFEGQTYAPAPFVLRALEQLLSHPDVRIHIFSGGERPRNISVLRSLKTSNGKSLLEQIEARGGQVWSASDLTTIGSAGGNIDRFRKRIEKLLPGANPLRLILIDDQTKFGDGVLRAIPSYGAFNDRLAFDASKIGAAYEPVSELDWRAERQRWIVLSALLEEALATDRAGQTSFRDFLLRETSALGLGSSQWKSWLSRGRELFLPKTKAKSCNSLFES